MEDINGKEIVKKLMKKKYKTQIKQSLELKH